MLYVAYGSNMNVGQMRARCPGARLMGRGLLAGYRLAFRGHDGNCHATIEKAPAGRVPVLLWNITPADERALDRYEGFPSYYRKERVVVGHARRLLVGMVYVMNGCDVGAPSASYYAVIQRGYADAGIDEAPLAEALREAQAESRRRANA